MAKDFDFYFDFSSPYGYFAAMRIEALAQKYDRAVKWHPILLGVVFKSSGAQPLTMIPLKGEYSLHDIARTARFNDIPYKHPASFPVASQVAARAVLWLQNTVGDGKASEFAKKIYSAYFVDGMDIGNAENVAKIATQIGIDAAAMAEAVNSAPIKEQLKAEVDQAIRLGVFGSPYIIVDGEPFWGFDRFHQLEAFLKNGSI